MEFLVDDSTKNCMIDFEVRALTCGNAPTVGYCMIDLGVGVRSRS